jgi:hypothetical protein
MKIRLTAYIKREFAPGSEPDQRTVRAMLMRGELSGRLVKLGGGWWVEVDAVSTGNEVADRILQRVAS